jgi:glucokinase
MKVLAGDIGATNARLAVVEVEGPEVRFLEERHYESTRYNGLEPILREFLGDLPERPEAGCLGVPGPVVGGRARLPILGWNVKRDSLAEAAGISRLEILNDFEVLARSIPVLSGDDLVTLHQGSVPDPGRHPPPLAVVGAGTGLGHAYLTWAEGGYRVHPSEGGHGEFSPRSALEWELREYLAARHGRVSVERVVSGPGLPNIYRFLADSGRAPESPRIRERMAEEDPAGVVAEHGLEGSDPLCAQALEILVSAYGSHAGDVALVLRAEGGVFLAGGVPPRILPKLQDGTFLEAFLDKGRLTPLLERVPVQVVVNPRAALVGAADLARGLAPGDSERLEDG